MVTSKQAEEFRFAITGGGLLGGVMPTGTDVVALCTTVINTERDAALGRAVRGVVDRGEHTIDVLDGAIVGLVPTLGPEVLRVVLAHLREEQKGAP